jgi:hypothetical protein
VWPVLASVALAVLIALPASAFACGASGHTDGTDAALATQPAASVSAARQPNAGGQQPAASSPRTSINLRATYRVAATVNWGKGRLSARAAIHVLNTSGGPIERLELNAIPARIGHMRLDPVTVDGRTVRAWIHGETIRVPLGRILAAGGEADVVVSYRAWFTHNTAGHNFLFTKGNGVLTAYRWIPWISRDVRYETSYHGDPFYTPVSPRVEVTLRGNVPMSFATSGRRIAQHGQSRTYLAENVRDFNFAAARDFRITSGRSQDGDTRITVYTRHQSGSVILKWAKRAIAEYERRFGQYAYPTLTLAESSGGIAMESPGHITLPAFEDPGRIPFLVAHEVAHQWWYAVVGNNQTTDPFMDEALADFSSRHFLGLLRSSRCRESRLDLSIYQYHATCYYEIVYIQGANFLNNLRKDMGDGVFWRALRRFYQGNKFTISSTRKLLQALRNAAGNWVLPRYHKRFPSLY